MMTMAALPADEFRAFAVEAVSDLIRIAISLADNEDLRDALEYAHGILTPDGCLLLHVHPEVVAEMDAAELASGLRRLFPPAVFLGLTTCRGCGERPGETIH